MTSPTQSSSYKLCSVSSVKDTVSRPAKLTTNHYQPKSLFSVCLRFIAQNLDHVDSFEGFPPLIGEKIFQTSLTTARMLSDDIYSRQAIQLFSTAFQEELLSSLNLSRRHLGLNYYEDHFKVFIFITQLDVSDCGLGDDHEMIIHIGSLQRLKKLAVRNNSLSDTGIQRLSTSYRMFNRGPGELETCDLSENADVTAKSLKYLSKFQHLHHVTVTDTSIVENCEWKLVTTSDKAMLDRIETTGWAASLVQDWVKKADAKAKCVKPSQTRKTASQFYSGRKKQEIEEYRCHQTRTTITQPCKVSVVKVLKRVLTISDSGKSRDTAVRKTSSIFRSSRISGDEKKCTSEEDTNLDFLSNYVKASDRNLKGRSVKSSGEIKTLPHMDNADLGCDDLGCDESLLKSYLSHTPVSTGSDKPLKQHRNFDNKPKRKRKISILDVRKDKRQKNW